MMTQATHIFEAANLGTAPFTFLGHADRGRGNLTGCAYCGTAIRHEFLIAGSDDRKFVVGSECVYKTGDAGLIGVAKKAERAYRNAAARERRVASGKTKRISRRIALLRERREKARAILAKMPGDVRNALRVHRAPGADLDIRMRLVVSDMRMRIGRGIQLSDKATDWLLSIARDAFAVKAEVPEVSYRTHVVGKLASIKCDEDYGWRMLIEVQTDAGSYKIFGSVPSALHDTMNKTMDKLNDLARAAYNAGDEASPFYSRMMFQRPELRKFIGMEVSFDAQLIRSARDASFGFFKRPTKFKAEMPSLETIANWSREEE